MLSVSPYEAIDLLFLYISEKNLHPKRRRSRTISSVLEPKGWESENEHVLTSSLPAASAKILLLDRPTGLSAKV